MTTKPQSWDRRSSMRATGLAAVAALTLAACSDEPVSPERGVLAPGDAAFSSVQADDFVPGRVLARFTPGANEAAVAAAAGAQVDRDLVLGIRVLSVPAGREAVVVRALSNNPNVEFAEPDYIRTFGDPTAIPLTDPLFGYKWDLDNDGTIYNSNGVALTSTGSADADMDWLEAWEQLGAVSGSAKIGIMDTGIRADHEELVGRIFAQYDFFDDDGDAADDNGHGTHVAGIAAAATDNSKGVAGVAFASDIQFVIAKVCGTSFIFYSCPSSAIADGIVWAVDNDADVLNLSLGGSTGSSSVQSALQYARSNNVLPFCAAGNDGLNAVSYPGAWPECVAVSATDWGDDLASYSNWGPEIELSAPGGDDEDPNGYSYIASSYYDATDSYVLMAGTSMASPQAAGLGALLHALGVTDDDDKLTRMKSSADDLGASGWDEKFGEGRLNVYNAVNGLGGGTPNDPPTASFTYTCTDLSCDFDATGSSDGDGSIIGYDWDFGDGNTGSGATINHTYSAGGTYTVTLSVTDDDGATDGQSQDVSVSEPSTNSPPTASFTYGCSDLTCSFDGSGSSDSDGSITGYDWDFGDGNSGSGATASHTYASGGTYTVMLTVTDDGGAEDSASQDVTVTEPSTGITLAATGYKERGRHHADLAWSGATSAQVDVYRDGGLIGTTANDGFYTDATGNRGKGSYSYQVCEAGTSTCSNEVTVTF